MLSFKEYTLMNFQNIIAEKIKAHFLYFTNLSLKIEIDGKTQLRYQAPSLVLENFKYDFSNLEQLKNKNDGSDIAFFMQEIDNKAFFQEALNNYKVASLVPQRKKYYDIVYYYLRLNNKPNGSSGIDASLSKEENIMESIKETYAKELFNIAYAVSINVPDNINEQLKQVTFEPVNVNKFDNAPLVVYKNNGDKTVLYPQKNNSNVYSDINERLIKAYPDLNESIDNNLISMIDSV